MISKADGLIDDITLQSKERDIKHEEYEACSEPNVEDDPTYTDLKAQLFLLEIEEEPGADTEELARLEDELSSLKSKKANLETELNKFKLIDDIENRVIEL